MVRYWARRRPDAPATWFEGRTRTWQALDLLTDRLAAGLVERLGVRTGDRVAILDQNSDDYVALLYACDKAGAVATLLNWRLTGSEVAQLVGDAEAKLLVVGETFRSVAEGAGTRVVGFGELPLIENGPDPTRDDERRTSWQLYTSGTTGLPKGAMISGHNLFSTIDNFSFEAPEMRIGSRCLVATPLYHTGGAGWCTAVLLHGGTAVILRQFEAQSVLQAISQEAVSVGFVVPSMLAQMVDAGAGIEYPKLKSLLYGASPIAPSVLERAIATFGCRFTQVYGLTETTGPVTFLHHEDHRGARLLSCGRPSFGSRLKVVDPDGAVVAPGDIGEILYSGPGLIEGYWNRPEESAAAIRDGWFHTGDAGSMEADGYLYIKDRRKDMIVSGAENVYPAEVEGILAGHPDLADVAIIGVPDERWGEAVKAIVVSRRPGLTEAAVIEWARTRLAPFKTPRSVDFVEELPRNPSGKILKRQLREPYWASAARQVN